ncbi:MAG: hypothetical protein ACC628_08395, partial [Pirellulaceae bacterium]
LTSEKTSSCAPGVDKPEALVRESLDGAFCHLSNSPRVSCGVARKHRVQAAPLQTYFIELLPP